MINMKKIEKKDIQTKTDADLQKLCKEYGDSILKARFDAKGADMRGLRKSIARIKTELRARELNK